MTIRQEESTPIGDFFHDSGVLSAFTKLEEVVDEFNVETDTVTTLCDTVIEAIKGLKGQVKKVESAWQKRLSQEKVSNLINRGIE